MTWTFTSSCSKASQFCFVFLSFYYHKKCKKVSKKKAKLAVLNSTCMHFSANCQFSSLLCLPFSLHDMASPFFSDIFPKAFCFLWASLSYLQCLLHCLLHIRPKSSLNYLSWLAAILVNRGNIWRALWRQ